MSDLGVLILKSQAIDAVSSDAVMALGVKLY
jgi:hypothetical protein